ncbi:VOC family protein [Halorarum halophilum]|uniref:VOC family protein n=1 Tax=Halorarum halophilum TaxID=2743090 RepID=A0A7D5GAY6_9EURY|nr:VOC family protein [Halobaculum halophilum]QLG26912.1 VOC family protein [Halobaculum halophilum]
MSGATEPLPESTRVGRTVLHVADLAGTTAFYQRVVGLAVLTRERTTATLGVDGTPLLVLEADADAPERDESATGLYHNAFRVPTRGALGDALARIRNHWHLDGASDHGFSEALYLADPEGNGVEIYRDRPREDWPFREDGRLRGMSDPLDLDALATDAIGGTGAPAGTTVGHVHLEVSSTEAAREFYAGTLGFDVTTDLAPSALFLSAGGYHHHVAVNTWHQRSTPAAGRGLEWFELILPDGDAVAAVAERVEASGGSVAELDDGVEIADPDGIAIRLRPEE